MTKRQINDVTAEPAPMEQVRELLFGAQLKDMETRFRRQEDRFVREVSDAKESLRKRIDSLENFMKSEVAAILTRIKEEQNEREESLKSEQRERVEAINNEMHERAEAIAKEQQERAEALAAELRERNEAINKEQRERNEAINQLAAELTAVSDTLERKIAKLSDNLDATERELRTLLMDESKSLDDKIESKYQDALAVISKTASQIRHDMVYRSSLSSMFAEMVVKLSGAQWGSEGAMLDAAIDENFENQTNQDDSE